MATSEDINQQLAVLLKTKRAVQIRKTDDIPPRISSVDVAMAITGKCARKAAQDIGFLKNRYPDVAQNLNYVRFPDALGHKGKKDTPVCDARGIVEIMLLLPGRHAAMVRRQAAALLVRYLGGDITLVDEVYELRGFQEQLVIDQPGDPRRVFGIDVEAPNGAIAQQLANACADAVANVVPMVVNNVASRIIDRLALSENKHRINLNVRAPKRLAFHDPPIATSIEGAGRPLPLARFLDQKELDDPTWRAVRRSLAPFFGMQMQILKKTRLREGGVQAIYVEQNHRPQLFYTENDRPLMQEAWEMMAAHRDDLVNRSSLVAIPAPTITRAKPRVLAMLERRS